MRIGWPSLVLRTAPLLVLLTLGAQDLLAQTGRAWVDPPADPAAPADANPAPPEPRSQAPAPNPSPPVQTAAPPPVSRPEPPAAPAQEARPARPEPAAPPPAQEARPTRPEPALPPAQEARPARPEPPPFRPQQPAQAAPPVQPAPPAVAAQPRERRYSRDDAARSFAMDYLNSWSGANEAALDATAEFYAPRVLFHGRTIGMQALMDEKRRFMRRWPERDYRPRPDSIGVTCNPAGEVCTVHTVFDFIAANPESGKRSEGTGALQLIVQFIGNRPIIVAEHSTLLGQDHNRD